MSDQFIHFDAVSKDYGAARVVDGLDFSVRRGEFVSLLGPSGSGKTTILMMLAGFEPVSAGEILLDGEPITAAPPHKRDMGVVFQSYALFPHLNVGRNIAFPLEMRGVARAEIRERVDRALDMVQLLPMKERLPGQLSGGQQQRVALARALVFEPRVVLMDEPLGALDKQLREQMQLDIRRLHHELGLTIVFVTHDQHEALTMSDRIAVFDRGRIQQYDVPREVYDRPSNRFVAEFIGETNLLPGEVVAATGDRAELKLETGGLARADARAGLSIGEKALISLRPERLALLPADEAAPENALPAVVRDTIYQGDHLRVELSGPVERFVVHLDRKSREWAAGDEVLIAFGHDDGFVIPA
ncbi:MAG: ABC transporter ATP-binding protein [Pikeienuella sp.]